jgi:hypothetical protein
MTYKYQNRIETETHVIGIRKSNHVYHVTILDKKTNNLLMKCYQKKTAINNITQKYGVNIEF